MHQWTFEDGTVVKLGGAVSGKSPFAAMLRQGIRKRVMVPLVTPYEAPLDPSNPFLLAVHLALQQFGKLGVKLASSTYEPKLSDAPADVQKKIADIVANQDPGRIH